MAEDEYYPVRFAVRYPGPLSRLLNFPLLVGFLIKLVLAFPIVAVVSTVSGGGLFAGIADQSSGTQVISLASSIFFFGPFAILFTGRYPRGLWYVVVGVLRMQARISVYLASLSDRWPNFSLDERDDDVFDWELDYPPTLNRWLNLPIVGFVVKAILVVPHLLILFFTGIAVFFVVIYAQFAILFTGRFPRSMFNFVAGWLQLSFRVAAYVYSLTDRYPPFSFDPLEPRPGPA